MLSQKRDIHSRHAKSSIPERDNIKSTSDYQIFNLKQEAKLYKEIQDIDPAEHVRVSERGLAKIRAATQQDPMLQEVAKTIHQGWPESKQDVPLLIRAFWPFRDEPTEHDKIIYKGTKIIIPKSMQPEVKQRIHISHQGLDACVQRTKDVLFWPGMASKIRHLVSQCSVCNDYAAKQQKEPLISTEIPSKPWSIVAQDLFTFDHRSYLITVDFYSDFWELDALTETSSETIVACTKAHFSQYGIPDSHYRQRPTVSISILRRFCKKWEFYHTTSLPYHHQSNGKAESAVKIAKRLLKKATQDKKDINLAILEWRNTPTEGGCYSPAQKLQSRRTRTLLPTAEQLLYPEIATNVVGGIQHR